MFCDRCGAKLELKENFCPTCGKPTGKLPKSAERSRIGSHVQLLGILWLAVSAIRLLPGLFILGMFHQGLSFLPPDVPSFVPGLIRIAALLFLGGGLFGIVVGWGLLTWQPWARILAIVAGCLSLLDMPFGTAIGVYTLWVLLPERSGQEYQARAVAA